MKRSLCVLCLLAIVLTSSTAFAARGGGRRHRGGHGCTSESLSAPIDDSPTHEREHQLLKALNKIREAYGLKALILDIQLHRTARQHCQWMANRCRMVHSVATNENIAAGQPDVDAVMDAWMNSTGHRDNILNSNYTKVGLTG
jgi:uncharacterized protein YkwD